MTFDPRTQDEIFDSLKNRLTGRLSALTNFGEKSFNYVWGQAFSFYFHRMEAALLAAQLSGWPDWAGKTLTQDDLTELGIDGVDPALVNEYISSQDLDELAKLMGITRDPGQKATGEVTFTTASDTVTVPEGTEVTTQPDSEGNFYSFFTDAEVSPASGSTTVTANVTAAEVGTEYNVGAGTISHLPSAPIGVEDVTNNNAMSGGQDEQTNDSLRSEVKEAVFTSSGGGTAKGIEGYIENNVDGVTQDGVIVDEYPNASPPYADVIVDGGTGTDVQNAIDFARPVAVTHNLVRPTSFTVSLDVNVEGTDVDTATISAELENYVKGLGLGQSFIRDKAIHTIFSADSDVENITKFDVWVDGEPYTFSSTQDIYALTKGTQMEQDGITEVTDDASNTYVEDTDYQELDNDADGEHESIDWSLAGSDPADGATFYVDYLIEEDLVADAREKLQVGTVTVSVV